MPEASTIIVLEVSVAEHIAPASGQALYIQMVCFHCRNYFAEAKSADNVTHNYTGH